MVTSYGYFKCGSIPADVISAVWGGRGIPREVPHTLVSSCQTRPPVVDRRACLG